VNRIAPFPASLLLASLLAAAAPVDAQQPGAPMCTEVKGWAPQLAPEDTLGLVAGVAIDPQGRVVAFRRAGRPFGPVGETPISRPAVLVLDPANGRVITSWGVNQFYVPHSISFDSRGNVWTADTGLHQVMQFSPDGRLLLQVGEAKVPGADERHFPAQSNLDVGPSSEVEHGSRVLGHLASLDIARHAGDGHEVDLRRGARVQQGEGVVDAGVAVDEEGAGHGSREYRSAWGERGVSRMACRPRSSGGRTETCCDQGNERHGRTNSRPFGAAL